MAFPVINSPFLPSVADAPFLPPKLKDMPVSNPGVSCYECEDGIARYMTEAQAINMGISCKVVDPARCSGYVAPSAPMVVGYPVLGYPVMNMGRGNVMGIARVGG
jgi:hypothetical protein